MADGQPTCDGVKGTYTITVINQGDLAASNITVGITDAGTLVNSAEISDVTPLGPNGQPVDMPNGTLASTGNNTLPLVTLGLLLMLAGGWLILGLRRRRSTAVVVG